MQQWSITEIADIVSGKILGVSDIIVEGLAVDSRKVKFGDLFVPLVGENVDGHQFIADAFRNGAVAALAARKADNLPQGTLIIVDDPLTALQKLGITALQRVSPQVIAVTGSTGKPSTKEMIASILAQKYRTFKTKGNLNSESGLPMALYSLSDDDQIAVLEMGMRGRGQITELVSLAPPDIAVITNIGQVHLELLGTQENLALAKGEILEGLKDGGLAVLNGDDKWCRWLRENYSGETLFFGQTPGCDFQAVDLTVNETGYYSYTVKTGADQARINLPVAGKHQVYNSLVGITLGRYLGMSWAEILNGIASYQTIKGRQYLRECRGAKIIDDTYNSNPDSIRTMLELLKFHPCQGRRIAVLGDMRELGSQEKDLHLLVGREIKKYNVDILICNGRLAAYIGQGASEMPGQQITVFYAMSNSDVLSIMVNQVQEHDVVLIKGSRGLGMEQIVHDFCKGN